MFASSAALVVALLPLVAAQGVPIPPGSAPHDYPDKPSGAFSPAWQSYFEVTDPLPNVTFSLGRNWAGNIPVDRPGHPNNTLFFWAFEKESGSLTANAGERSDAPWGIWLNGGPGSSSLLGLMYENGPIHVGLDDTIIENPESWDRVADYIWIDQPVGTGFSTADRDGFIHDEDEMGRDFMGFLANLVKVFPSLKTRPLYLTGESYAGTYIPYIMKTYFGMADPPVKIAKFAIGDGTVGSEATFELLPMINVIETYPQLIGYDQEVFQWFKDQAHRCQYDLNLTYPQNGHFPTLKEVNPTDPNRATTLMHQVSARARNSMSTARRTLASLAASTKPTEGQQVQKRDLSLRTNGTLDDWYGCFLFDAVVDYALNYSAPWNVEGDITTYAGFDVYDIPDALNPSIPFDGRFFFNDPRVRAALHAPTSKNWAPSIQYPFLGGGADLWDPSPEPMVFLDALAANASAHAVGVVLYSGNDDALIAHRGTEVVIQNTTFGGVQGFTRKPSTAWYDDAGAFAGVVHQERNWTYVLVDGAGHLIPNNKPAQARVLLREFIIGNNRTGLVVDVPNGGGAQSVVGGEDAPLVGDVLPGQREIFTGVGKTEGSYVYPTATIAAWESFRAAQATGADAGVRMQDSGAAAARGGALALAALAGAVSLLAYL